MKQQLFQYSMVVKRSLIGVLLLVMTACGVLAPQTTQPNIPSVSYFEQQYYAAQDNVELQSLSRYLGWVEQFYQGSLLQPKGWADVVIDSVASVSVSQQQGVENAANNVGKKIAAEWAKDNSIRKITTRHVSVWGLALREAVDRGEIGSLLEQVEVDVDALLSDDLDKKAVNAERYYEPEYNEFF